MYRYNFFKTNIKGHRSEYLILLLCYILVPIILLTGCKKLVEVDPPSTNLTSATVYNNDATAAAVMTGLYTKMSASGFGVSGTILQAHTGILADELDVWSGYNNAAIRASYTNQLYAQSAGPDYCGIIYPFIYTANSAIENLTAATKLTSLVKEHLLGEAKFCRAFCYFYLVNLYGAVPLTTTSDYVTNSVIPRSPVVDVYKQIISDLKDAEQLLSDDYLQSDMLNTSIERLRPNKGAAAALLARVYLYTGDWKGSEEQASSLINDSTRYRLVPLNDVFLKTSSEAIWQLQAISNHKATNEGVTFILNYGPNGSNPYYISEFLQQAFEADDQRNLNWVNNIVFNGITYYFPYKYKESGIGTTDVTTEASTVFRLAEQYLIRAEARAQLGMTEEAAGDLNVIRNRSGLPNTTAISSTDLLAAILKERQVELFTEWGHRWFDLKRTQNIDAVMLTVTPAKGGSSWNSYQQLMPFSTTWLDRDPALTQNEGY